MPTVTLAQMQQRVLDRVESNTQFFATLDVNTAINEAIRSLNLATGWLQTSFQITTLPDRVWYDLPCGLLLPLRMQYETRFLEKNSVYKLGRIYPQWTSETTTSVGMEVSRWVPCGLKKFGIHPADGIGGGLLTVTGIQEPIALVNQTDTITFPNEFGEMLEDLSFITLVLKQGGKIFGDAAKLYQIYLSKIKKVLYWQGVKMPSFYVEEMSAK